MFAVVIGPPPVAIVLIVFGSKTGFAGVLLTASWAPSNRMTSVAFGALPRLNTALALVKSGAPPMKNFFDRATPVTAVANGNGGALKTAPVTGVGVGMIWKLGVAAGP